MKNAKNVEKSKMSLAASKAWITRRLNQSGSSSLKEKKNVKKNGKEKREVKDSGMLRSVEAKEMAELNGTELDKIAKQTQKMLDRKAKMDQAKTGRKDLKSVDVGKIIKKAKIERFNGGVKFSGAV